jgi:hypothetical protein
MRCVGEERAGDEGEQQRERAADFRHSGTPS